jgi:hypothetical protein
MEHCELRVKWLNKSATYAILHLSPVGHLMPPSNTARLATFARLIAAGYPPVLAAKAAGYRNLRASRAATRLTPPPPVAEPEPPRAAASEPVTEVADDDDEWPPKRMPTEEEWVAKYAYLAIREAERAQ